MKIISASGRGLGAAGLDIMRLVGLLMLLAFGAARADDELAREADFHIAAQSLSSALIEFSDQSGVQVMTDGQNLTKLSTQGVQGRYVIGKALKVLLGGTGLAYSPIGQHTVAISGGSALADSPTTVADAEGGNQLGAKSAPGQDVPGSKVSEQDLSEVVVVGSRLPQSVKDSAVPVKVYSRQDIDASGASSVVDFLNTLPEVSTQTTVRGTALQESGGATTVQLRGLPVGTTLVLLNGRRVESSTGINSAGGFFDLNSIPLAVVDRIEVLPTGSSAIYGGDGLGGAVNIVLKQGFNGGELNARYGATVDGAYNESGFNLAFGIKKSKWSASIIALYSDNSELSGDERAITANQNYTAFGGTDARYSYANPGNVCSTNGQPLNGLSTTCAGVPAGSTGVGLTTADFAATAGVLNKASFSRFTSYIAPSRTYGTFLAANYQVLPWVQVFSELMYDHFYQDAGSDPPFKALSVPASNPYNPFNEAVTVDYLFTGIGREKSIETMDYLRPLVGLRGKLADKWHWEVAGWTSRDWSSYTITNDVANTAAITSALAAGTFNPFQDGPGATSAVLNTLFQSAVPNSYRGAIDSANGFIRGPVLELPSGTVEAAVGGEYQRDTLGWFVASATTDQFAFHRENEAAFTELKIPLVANREHPESGDILSTQLALRYDRYSDFGSHTSPQAGMEFRPARSILIRGSYSAAFKPPSLHELYLPGGTYTAAVKDPLRGNQSEAPTVTIGGNPDLNAETGWSKTFGLVFSPQFINGLDISVTNWSVHIKNGILTPVAQDIVNNPQDYPGRVTRSAPAAGDTYIVGPITAINDTFDNFGFIDEAGVDGQITWRYVSSVGTFSPSLSLTEIYRYQFELTPAAGAVNADSQANDQSTYAPRYKGTLALSWTRDRLQIGVDGRYTGWYRDVTDLTTSPRELGNFWYVDANSRYELGRALAPQSKTLSGAVLTVGMRNILNKMPPYSEKVSGSQGFDASEYDLQGRFFWMQMGVRF